MNTSRHGRVAITGASGFLGRALTDALSADGWAVRRLVRRTPAPDEIGWDPAADRIESGKLEGIDAVVHLAGENLAGLWTPAKRQRILQSRVQGTRLLAQAVAGLSNPPAVVISASGVGYYGNAGEEELTEASPVGDDFLARVCLAWEGALAPAESAGIRVIRSRFGVILHPAGGMLKVVLPLFRLGLGARLGSGAQWLSWVALADAVRAVRFLLETSTAGGPVNVCSPFPVRNEEFTRTLAAAVGRPAFLAVPAFALRAFTGAMGETMLLTSQRALPAALLEHGFEFERARLDDALAAGLD